MAKMGKKTRSVMCMCDTVSNSEGINCECWGSGEDEPIVLAERIFLGKKKKERFGPSPKRFR